MAEQNAVKHRFRRVRHRGRGGQILIYLGKQLRFFINESDWKVLPMSAVIAALVSMVIRNKFFVNMEGCLIGAFALCCVAIWNGCFNSIQSVCRERPIIKREHRSGMHVSSYVAAHMIYQFLLCVAQTGLTMYVLRILGVPIPLKGFVTPFMIIDIGISMLLITYASDMMSLFISSISHTTTGAMTVMPFVLIFQLVFSGGIIPLPAWSQSLSDLTISNYGIRVLAAQSGYNEQPMVTGWNTLRSMRDMELGGTTTIGEIVQYLEGPTLDSYRDTRISDFLDQMQASEEAGPQSPVGDMTIGELIDVFSLSAEEYKDQIVTVRTTVGKLIDLIGEEKVKTLVEQKTAEAAFKPQYDRDVENIAENWIILWFFTVFFAVLSTIVLELIDRDKR